jgi:acetyl-CoA carboxylase biotin carboxyl carrier protein
MMASPQPAGSPVPGSSVAQAVSPAGVGAELGGDRSAVDEAGLVYVTSPIVGTLYRAPNPEAPPFVEVGALVRKGQVLCIVEAMKLMNEIESELAGTVVKVLVENAQPVEFGQRLFAIRSA